MSKKGWSDEELEQCATLLRQHLKSTEIAAAMGKTKGSVIGMVQRHPMLKKIGFYYAPLPLTLQQRKMHDARLKKHGQAPIEIKPAGLTLVDLTAVHCRYPLWGHYDRLPIEERFFCGAARLEDSSYCAKHQKVCRAQPKGQHVRA